jgi:hypothetical protein
MIDRPQKEAGREKRERSHAALNEFIEKRGREGNLR